MVRTYAEPVEVRPAGEGDAPGAAPASFLWRGRLYVVRDVLGHWRERRAWWTAPAARAVHGEEQPDGSGEPGSPLSQEREVWRVEASAGRTFASGVYDLCRDLRPGETDPADPAPGGAWRMLRVAD